MADVYSSRASAPARATNPFVLDALPTPFSNTEPASVPAAYVMVASGPRVERQECELSDVASLEVVIAWGSTILHVAHLTPPRAFRIGSDEHSKPDFVIGEAQLGVSEWQLVAIESGVAHVLVP
ncbi:MAG TPA: hypothetical protein VK524_07315, partial [Polyangiaceae bacterium]|nr:hypothetical protein [Polyangiaceae bacterium]